MLDAIDRVIADLGLNILETVEVPERPEIRAPVPKRIAEGPAYPVISKTIPGGQVWKHQAQAWRDLTSGKNVVVSTGTASGKSLIFQTYALHLLLTDPGSKVLVFYPLRALTNDQLISWQRLVEAAGLGRDSVGRIYGGVPMAEGEQTLERSRIVLMTPDVCQARLMRTVSNPTVKKFIESLSLLILDEAHVYESVFGSNTAFLLRRLMAAKRILSPRGTSRRFQVIATTATIDAPAQHLENLTGVQFNVVDEAVNGAPRSQRRILHIEPDSGSGGETTVANIVSGICSMSERHRFIAFVDSRQGTEWTADDITKRLGNPNVKPYRSGFAPSERAAIERALNNGTLHGVVSTSALELGIDIADMEIGINLGVPQSRKSFRQRLGRVGRTTPGVFLVVGPDNAFTRFGESLASYYESSVEPSYLYLGNRFIQFTHARCLRDELEALGRNSGEAPAGVQWPEGFPDILSVAREGYPREFDPISQIGGDSPHFNYPLRQLGEINVEIRQGRGGFDKDLGEMAYHQAIREAYPGATYRHSGEAYKVNRWNWGFNKLAIHVTASKNAAPTRPILRKSVTIDLSKQGIIPGRFKKGEKGILAEAEVQIIESVEGYIIGNTRNQYRELQAKDPNMRRKQREFRTTGVVVKIEEDWFSVPAARKEVADGLRDLLARERSIATQDIDSAHTNIALATDAGLRRPITDVVVIYDSVYGGLRLTENLFDGFNRYIERLSLGAELSHGEGVVSIGISDSLRQWAQDLSEVSDFAYSQPTIEPPSDGNWLLVFNTGSLVSVFNKGESLEREIIEPRYIESPFEPGSMVLYYSYRDPVNKGGTSFTPADSIQASGHDWEWVWWNPDTGEYRDLEVSE